jgi:hypothetical protein
VLYAPNQFEPVLIHNPFIHQLSREMGRYSPRTRFVELYFNRTTGAITSTHYAGIYVLEEKIKISPDRVAIDELEAENLTPPSVTGGYLLKIDRLAGEVRQAQPREYQKWRVGLRGGSYQSEVNLMKNWVSNRLDFIDRQLTQPPRLSHPGGTVTAGVMLSISRPTNATVYYTLDGTDPRSATGGIASQARVYDSPLALLANARVVARAYDATKRQVGGPPSTASTPWW